MTEPALQPALHPPVQWQWQPRPQPGQPQAAVAWGETARRLHARLLLNPEAPRLHATAHRDGLVVTGAAADLPWVDGIEYACLDERAPGLWLPTHWQPAVPVDLLGQALAKALARSPILLWHAPCAAVPLDRQLPLSGALLQRIASCWAGC